MPPKIDGNKCDGCGICDSICPGDVIHMDEETRLPVVKYPKECWHCGSCRQDCPRGAIEVYFPPEILI